MARISAEYLGYIESKICVKKFANVYLTVTSVTHTQKRCWIVSGKYGKMGAGKESERKMRGAGHGEDDKHRMSGF